MENMEVDKNCMDSDSNSEASEESEGDLDIYYNFSGTLDEDGDENNLPADSLKAFESLIKDSDDVKIPGKSFRYYKLPAEVAGLVGQANVCLAHGKYEETLQICKEVIRLAPNAYEIYSTLSEVYSELGDQEKSWQFELISATNAPIDHHEWLRLAAKAKSLNKRVDAIYCYKNALKRNGQLLHVYQEINNLLDEKRDRYAIINNYTKAVNHARPEIGLPILDYARKGAQLHMQDNHPEQALQLMQTALEKVPEHVRAEDVNLIAELYIMLKMYESTLRVISRHCNVTIEAELDLLQDEGAEEVQPSTIRVTSCVIHSELPVEIRTKLIISFIHLKAYDLIDEMLAPILDIVEDYGDLLIDIIEVFMTHSRHVEASKLLKILIDTKKYSLPQVWLHYADCLRFLGRKEEAVSAYLVVMDQAPHISEARFIVSELLNDLGRGDEAITALTQDPDAGYIHTSLLYERCLLLKDNPSKAVEFLAAGRLLLSRHSHRFRDRAEFKKFMSFNPVGVKKQNINIVATDHVFIEGEKAPSAQEEFELFLALCRTAFNTKQYPLLERIACSVLASQVIYQSPEFRETSHRMALLAAYFNDDYIIAYKLIKANFWGPEKVSNRMWNVFNHIYSTLDDTLNIQRVTNRLLAKRPNDLGLTLLFANNCFLAGSVKQALCEYINLHKNEPNTSSAFMIAISFLQLACRKGTIEINSLVAQGMGFLSQYREMRGTAGMQEVHYNFGRFNHQLGLYAQALYHYKETLVAPPISATYDLTREAAFNISRIYLESKSYEMARYYVEKYINI